MRRLLDLFSPFTGTLFAFVLVAIGIAPGLGGGLDAKFGYSASPAYDSSSVLGLPSPLPASLRVKAADPTGPGATEGMKMRASSAIAAVALLVAAAVLLGFIVHVLSAMRRPSRMRRPDRKASSEPWYSGLLRPPSLA